MKIINLNIMVIILLIIITSCRKNNTVLSSNTTSYENISNKKLSYENECPILDSLRMMITEYQGINIYTEDIMRGEGVLELFIENNIKILNIDKTLFGNIQKVEDEYNIQFPKKIVAREMFPQSEYKVFSFDS